MGWIARLVGVAALMASALPAVNVPAAPQDYRFELVGRPVKTGRTVRFEVRLMRVGDGGVVAGATIAAVDFNMSPEGMAGSNPVMALPASEPGVQPFEVVPEMAGRWELQLVGHIDGEPAEIPGRLVIVVPQ